MKPLKKQGAKIWPGRAACGPVTSEVERGARAPAERRATQQKRKSAAKQQVHGNNQQVQACRHDGREREREGGRARRAHATT